MSPLFLLLASALPPTGLGTEGSPRREFLQVAFAHADAVIRVKVGRPNSLVIEEFSGFRVARNVPLQGLPPEVSDGHEVLIAATQCGGASPTLCVLAWLPDTAEHRRAVAEWALPPWRLTPIVAVVTIAKSKDPGRIAFDVVRVLRGEIGPKRLVDNAWGFETFRSLAPGPQKFVMSAWGISTVGDRSLHMPWVHALTPITNDELPVLEHAIRAPHANALDTVAALKRAWAFHEAPLVAETEVGLVAAEPTNCGFSTFTLVPRVWLRGEGAPLSKAVKHSLLPVVVEPFLFIGTHGCEPAPERPKMRFLAAGWKSGGAPTAMVDATEATRRDVDRFLAAADPRFAARPVEALGARRAPPPVGSDFEPDGLRLDALSSGLGLTATRFEVVDRAEASATSDAWILCRALPGDPGGVWKFTGPALPAWEVGTRLVGHWVPDPSSAPGGSLVERHALFLPGLFAPADARLDLLEQVTRQPRMAAASKN